MRIRIAGLLVPILGLLVAGPAAAVLIHQEGFNTNGAGTRYTVTGGGSSGGGTNFWARASTVTAPPITGFEGSTYWAGQDMDDGFGGGVLPRMVTIPVTGLNVTGYTGVTASILLAANINVWDGSQVDQVRLWAIDYGPGADVLLDTFAPIGPLDTSLRSTTFPARTLNNAFALFTYSIPVSIGNLGFRFEAWGTGDLEWVGFDDVRIEGTVVVPEPSPAALLGMGVALLALWRQGRARHAR